MVWDFDLGFVVMQENIQTYNFEILNFFIQCFLNLFSYDNWNFKTIVDLQTIFKLNYIISFQNAL